MNNKKKIIYFIEVLGWGGIETFIGNVLNNLDFNKYIIEIVCINKISDHFDDLFKRFNIKLTVLKKERVSNPIKRYFIGLQLFDRYLKDNPCSVIHFHISNAIDFLHVQTAKINKVKYRISHSHNSDVNKTYKRIGHIVLKKILCNSPTHKVGCSIKACEWLYGKSTEPVVLKNGIQTDKFIFNKQKRNEIRKKLNIEDKYVIIHIGRFNTQKNHRFLIELFNEYAKTDKNAVLLLIGAGEIKEEIYQYAQGFECSQQMMFCGEISDIPAYLSASDVFVLPSLYEGLPVVGIEAQTSGIACIFSDTITRELEINPNVHYCTIEDKYKWSEKLRDLKNNCRHIEDAQKIRQQDYDIIETVKKIEKIYDSLN